MGYFTKNEWNVKTFREFIVIDQNYHIKFNFKRFVLSIEFGVKNFKVSLNEGHKMIDLLYALMTAIN